ncbi:HAD family hydrolase [Acaryochloris marina]|nr:HAD family hydrolase [Acaryochloris marina]BDM79115.1 hydrolase [Acaryochloris marina MBIC10699]
MKLVMFDIDGTLTASNDLDDLAFVRTVHDIFGIKDISEDWTTYTHVTDACILREICEQQLGRSPNSEEIALFQKQLLQRLAQGAVREGGVFPIAGADALLEQLQASPDYQFCYAGGAWTASVQFKLQSAELPFADIPHAFADDHDSREGICQIALDRAQTTYQQIFTHVIYVGDGIWDVRASKNLGYPFIGIATGEDAQRLKAEGAPVVLPHYEDLQAFWDALVAIAP